MFVIVLTSGYDLPEGIGPFDSEEEANDHLDNYIAVDEAWTSYVVRIDNPNEDR